MEEKTIYLVVEGWIHPNNGDDFPFYRGFTAQEGTSMELFRAWFIKNKMKNCQVKSDFTVKEVTKEQWESEFNFITHSYRVI
jgi:hypothetical protein